MKNKKLLYTGVAFITLGVFLRIFSEMNYISIPAIIIGALIKIYYLKTRLKQGYKPGIELVFLIVGLLLFLPGVYIKSLSNYINPLFLFVPGLMLKGLFVILFIRKIRK